MEHKFTATTELELPREEVFAFFSDAANLEQITPPELSFKILTQSPVLIKTGTIIDYQIRLFGIPVHWRTLISKFDPPRVFVDEQLKGPYSQWVHTHSFEEVDGKTIIYDEVKYRLPFSPLGDIAFPLVRMQINRIFAYREKAISNALLVHRQFD